MKTIPLVRSVEFVLVSDEDYEACAKKNWYLKDKSITASHYKNGIKTTVVLSRFIYELLSGQPIPKSHFIEFEDGNRFNNCRENLILLPNHLKKRRDTTKRNSTGFKGVTKIHEGRYIAKITYNNIHRYIGTFDSPIKAAIAFNKKATELLGDRAFLNKVD